MKPRITRFWAKDREWSFYRDGKPVLITDIWKIYKPNGGCTFCITFEEACRAAKAMMERERI